MSRRIWMLLGACGSVVVAGVATAPAVGAITTGQVAGFTAPVPAASAPGVAVTFVVPTAHCGPDQPSGFQGVFSGFRLRVTGGSTGAGVAEACVGKSALYQPAFQINGTATTASLAVRPGDTVTVFGSENPTATSLTITDGAQTQTVTGAGATVTAVDVGDIETNCIGLSCSPVPKLGAEVFSAASINGQTLKAAKAVRSNLVDAIGQVQIDASTLSGGGQVFTDKWVFSCGNTAGRC